MEILKIEEAPSSDAEQAPNIELVPLLSTLRYKFLGLNSTYPVIVTASPNACQIDALLTILREHRNAIGCTLNDLKGIHPSVCML